MKAKLSSYHQSPRKARLVVDLVRGKRVVRALDNLAVLHQKQAANLTKLLLSAIANAKHNHSYKKEDLVVKSIMVDGGPMIKRWMPKAHGRATPVRERTAHVSLVLVNMPRKEKTTTKK